MAKKKQKNLVKKTEKQKNFIETLELSKTLKKSPELFVPIWSVLKNARSLHEESLVLRKAGFHQRADFLSLCSCEEYIKLIIIIYDKIDKKNIKEGPNKLGLSQNTLKIISNHEKKFGMIGNLIYKLFEPTQKPKNLNFPLSFLYGKLISSGFLKKNLVKFIGSYFKILREDLLYCDVRNKVKNPLNKEKSEFLIPVLSRMNKAFKESFESIINDIPPNFILLIEKFEKDSFSGIDYGSVVKKFKFTKNQNEYEKLDSFSKKLLDLLNEKD